MTDIETTRRAESVMVTIAGRIDSMTAGDVEKEIEVLIQEGERRLVVCLKDVNYLSSAGLRVFLAAQKQMRKISGKILFFQVPDNIYDIFKMTGMTSLFDFCTSPVELDALLSAGSSPGAEKTRDIDGMRFHYLDKPAEKGRLQLIGRHDKLAAAAFSEADVVSVRSGDFRFAAGLATLGDNYSDYKSFFGEAVIVDHSLFFYPAVKRPAVDYMLHLNRELDIDYKFFHGFGFNGSPVCRIAFENGEGFVELSRLVDNLLSLTETKLAGVVLIAESKGLWGMNLKSVPIMENRPPDGRDIFDPENFTDWVDFPVEPDNINHIIIGTGIAAADPSSLRPDVAALFSGDSRCHIHAGVFGKGPVSRQPDAFETELTRIISEPDVLKVQHLLGKSVFSSGLAAIIELEE